MGTGKHDCDMKKPTITDGTWFKGLMSQEIVALPSQLKVCKVYEISENDRGEANAKLICAAKDLLIACKNFVKKVETGKAKSNDSYSEMKKAIEKATL